MLKTAGSTATPFTIIFRIFPLCLKKLFPSSQRRSFRNIRSRIPLKNVSAPHLSSRSATNARPYNIFNSVNRDLLDRELLRLCDKTVSSYITKSYPESGSSRPNAAVMQRFIKCELFGLIIDWMNNGMNENAITELHSALPNSARNSLRLRQNNSPANNHLFIGSRPQIKTCRIFRFPCLPVGGFFVLFPLLSSLFSV